MQMKQVYLKIDSHLRSVEFRDDELADVARLQIVLESWFPWLKTVRYRITGITGRNCILSDSLIHGSTYSVQPIAF